MAPLLLSRLVRSLLLLTGILLLPLVGRAQATVYTWNVAVGNVSTAANWTPTRTVARNTDVLEINGNVTAAPTITIDADFTAAQLRFTNSVNAILSVSGAPESITLNGDGTSIPDLLINSGATVTFRGTDKNADLIMTLNGGATANISGTLIFTNSNSAPGQKQSTHLLSGTLNFLAGSTFRADPGTLGFPFGGNANSAVFHAGSTYVQNSGNSPMGNNGDVTAFADGSAYIYTAGTFATTGRSYGGLEFRASASVTSGTLNVKNNLVITSGTVNLSPTTLNLNGTVAQSIEGAGTLTLGPVTGVVINNAAGVVLARPLTIAGSLALTNGKLATTSVNPLTLGAGAGLTGGSANSFVNGPLTRTLTSTAANTALFFPVGAGSNYRPLTLTLTQSTNAATTYTAQQVEGRPTARATSGEVQRVSAIRYYTLSSAGSPFTNGSIKLSYGLNDQVDAADKLRVARSNGAAWVSQGGSGSMSSNGTTSFAGDITSSVPFTQLGEFVLGSSSNSENSLGNNPLPVELTRFSAVRQGAGVQLQWATASEKNNAYFQLERSTDGQPFTVLSRVAGQGQSQQAHAYTYLDRQPLSTLAYYRLRQVDTDGNASLSPTVAVAAAGTVQVYPNPVQSQLYVQLPGAAQYRILNALGQVMQQGQAQEGLLTLPVAELPTGIYQLELCSDAGRTLHKISK
ncbi:T9SS type A sorting domain-containing protein [Hymenobacter persicinus]|uniref:T9SS type A sorting domain-containing protein n=1 Tax=Hymenobacter persicinus TaxID=2025506 RepID=A0A4Q5L8H4_9BACT|nr:T9SS type A sorting domain-containing protein [Hymenobacter persicinus]RYU77723.1 T9SS type A sorting domain-containing protein [Hymenobacter persicinus]